MHHKFGILSVFAFSLLLLTSTAFAANIQILDIYPNFTSGAPAGNLTVLLNLTNTTVLYNTFNFWFDKNATNTLTAGPFNHTTNDTTNQSYVVNVVFNQNGTVFTASQLTTLLPLNVTKVSPSNSNITNVTFIFNSSYNYSMDVINITLGTPTYDQGGVNSTMATRNFVAINTTSSTSTSIGSVILMPFNTTTKLLTESSLPIMSDSAGFFGEACNGIVTNGACLGVAGSTPNFCAQHGIVFQIPGSQAPVLVPSNQPCSINVTTTIVGLDLVSSNFTIPQNVSTGTFLNVIVNKTGAMSMVFAMGFTLNPGPPQFLNVTSIAIYNATNQLELNQTLANGAQGPPAFLSPFVPYTIVITYQNTSGSSLTNNYSFMPTSSGMFGAMIMIPLSTTGLTTLKGQVLNSSGQAVQGAIVYAQMNGFNGPPMGIPFMNSTTTDSNGRFSLSVPTSQQQTQQGCTGCPPQYQPTYQIFVAAQNLSTFLYPQYFPTLDNNNQRGYAAIGSQVILPPITLKAGGVANVNVTLNGATGLLSEVSHLLNQASGLARNLFSGKMSFLKMFSGTSLPSSILVGLLAPTNSTPTSLSVTVFGQPQSFGGLNSPITSMCVNPNIALTQGNNVSVACNLTAPGYINITINTCTSIFPPTNCGSSPNFLSGFGGSKFWFMNKLIIKNASTTSAQEYLDVSGFIINNLMMGSPATSINVPVLSPGNYTVEIAPQFDFSPYLSVYNSTNITVNSTINGTIILNTLFSSFGQPWIVEPRFSPSLTLSGSNNINITVRDPNPNIGILNNTQVTVQGQFANLDKTTVGTSFSFTFDTGGSNNWDAAVTLSTQGVTSAGKYLLMVNVSNATSSGRFSLYRYFPVSVADFQVFLDASPFTFGTGSAIKGKIFALNSTTGAPISNSALASGSANATANATVTAYDQNGNVLTGYPVMIFNITGNSESNPTNQSISLPAINTTGFYNLITNVTANSTINKTVFGLSDTWIQVSNLGASISTDRFSYQITDNVILSVKVTNSTTGGGLANAALAVSVDSSQTTQSATTANDGTATVTLNPVTLTNANWTFGFHQIQVAVSVDTGINIIKQTLFTGFEVRGLQLFVQPTQPSYASGTNATINIFGTSNIPTVIVDTNTTLSSSNITQLGSSAWQATIITPSTGHHNVEVRATSSGGTQKAFTGFDISTYNVIATTDKFTYSQGSNATLSVTVLNATTGVAINAVNVTASLFKTQSPNDVLLNQTFNLTNTTGQVTLSLFATQPGFNYYKVSVGNTTTQSSFIGFQVSSLSVNLLSAARNNGGAIATSYSGSPGSTIVLYVNASNSTGNINDSSTVSATVWAFGTPIPLPTNTTGADISTSAAGSGNATIYFTIPSNVPAGTYGLDVKVTDSLSGSVGFAGPATLVVSGGSALSMSVSANNAFNNPYAPGASQTFIAKLLFPNGSAASGYNVSFETGSGSGTPTALGSIITSVTGIANVTTTAPTSDGNYFVHAYVTNASTTQAYSGFFVSSLNVTLATANTTYNSGNTVSVNVTVTNVTSGSQVSATGGFVSIFNKNKGSIPTAINTSQTQPYIINITVPSDNSSLGGLPIGAFVSVNSLQGIGVTLVQIVSSSGSLTFTLPTITAGQAFSVTLNPVSNTSTTASLQIFSPSASNFSYSNSSVPLGSSFTIPATAITNPGVYVFSATASGIGTNTTIVTVSSVASGTTTPAIWTSSGATNTTSFSSGGVVTIQTNTGNSTASIFYNNATSGITTVTSLPISQPSGSNFNTTFSPVGTGVYFVRLDTQTAVNAANTIITVS